MLKKTVCFDLNPRLAVQNIANIAIRNPDIWGVFLFLEGKNFCPIILMSEVDWGRIFPLNQTWNKSMKQFQALESDIEFWWPS